MNVMPEVYQNLILDSSRQLLPTVGQPLILCQNNRSGHAKIAVAESHLFEYLLFHGKTWLSVLGPAQHLRAFMIPGDAGVNRGDVITVALGRALRDRKSTRL